MPNKPATREERLVLEAARKYIKTRMPDRFMSIDGEGLRPRTPTWWDYVFVREDGWTLAAVDAGYEKALEAWSNEWIGGLEYVLPDPPWQPHYRIYIILQGRLEYMPGIIDLEGTFIPGEVERFAHTVDHLTKEMAKEKAKRETPRPRSLEQLREWMKRGCPSE